MPNEARLTKSIVNTRKSAPRKETPVPVRKSTTATKAAPRKAAPKSTATKKETMTLSTEVSKTVKAASKSTTKKPIDAPAGLHPLAHLVPPVWFFNDYIARDFDGHKDLDLLRYANNVRHNTLMFGPTGPGKTSCVYAYAASTCYECNLGFPIAEDGSMLPCADCGGTMGIPVVNVACNGAIDPSTLFVRPMIRSASAASMEEIMAKSEEIAGLVGQPWAKCSIDERLRIMETAAKLLQVTEEIVLVESDVVLVMRHGGILYFDEVNFMPPRVAAVTHGALDKRRTIVLAEKGNEAFKLSPKCQVIATYNPEYEGTKPLNPAFHNRFALKLEFTYERAIEEQFIVGIPALHDLADKLRAAHDADNLETPCGPNMLTEFEMFAVDLGVDFAISNFISAFSAEERSSVRNTVEHFKARIEQEAAAYIAEQEG